jgi:dihydrofolate reductase
MDYFANAIHKVPKVVFLNTLENVTWHTARLASKSLEAEILDFIKSDVKDIYVCSPSLNQSATNLNLIDEYHLCKHPVIASKGLQLIPYMNREV